MIDPDLSVPDASYRFALVPSMLLEAAAMTATAAWSFDRTAPRAAGLVAGLDLAGQYGALVTRVRMGVVTAYFGGSLVRRPTSTLSAWGLA